jgi:hypothetical protein
MARERRAIRTRRGDKPLGVVFAWAVAVCLFSSTGAVAQDQAELRASARRLALDAMDLADRGDCVAALPLLTKAEGLYHAPVHLQYLARCHAKLGHLVLAAETWRTLGREKLAPDAPAVFREAVGEALREIERLEPKLGTLVLEGVASYPNIEIELDGRMVPAAAFGAPLVVDPGQHRLRVKSAGYQPWEREFQVLEGGKTPLAVTLSESPTAPAPAAAPASPASRPGLVPPPAGDVGTRARGSAAAKVTGIALLTVGGATLVAGGIAWGVRNADRNELRQRCPTGECDFDPESDKSRIQKMTSITNVLMFGGAGVLLSGAVVFWISGRHEPAPITLAASATPDGAFVSLGIR